MINFEVKIALNSFMICYNVINYIFDYKNITIIQKQS